MSEWLFGPEYVEALLPVVCWSAICFVAGVAFAAYRAVDWVDRIRSWAMSTDCPESSEAVTGFVPAGEDDW